jgi:hypothetical protein
MPNPKNLAFLLVGILTMFIVFAIYTQTLLTQNSECNPGRKVHWPLQYDFKGDKFGKAQSSLENIFPSVSFEFLFVNEIFKF